MHSRVHGRKVERERTDRIASGHGSRRWFRAAVGSSGVGNTMVSLINVTNAILRKKVFSNLNKLVELYESLVKFCVSVVDIGRVLQRLVP